MLRPWRQVIRISIHYPHRCPYSSSLCHPGSRHTVDPCGKVHMLKNASSQFNLLAVCSSEASWSKRGLHEMSIMSSSAIGLWNVAPLYLQDGVCVQHLCSDQTWCMWCQEQQPPGVGRFGWYTRALFFWENAVDLIMAASVTRLCAVPVARTMRNMDLVVAFDELRHVQCSFLFCLGFFVCLFLFWGVIADYLSKG